MAVLLLVIGVRLVGDAIARLTQTRPAKTPSVPTGNDVEPLTATLRAVHWTPQERSASRDNRGSPFKLS